MAIIQCGKAFPKPYVRAGEATAGYESGGSCRRPEILGREAAAGEGMAIRVLQGEDTGRTARKPADARHPPDRDR